jgi:hypothetical protein
MRFIESINACQALLTTRFLILVILDYMNWQRMEVQAVTVAWEAQPSCDLRQPQSH